MTPEREGRDGRWFVGISLAFLGLFLAFLLFISPRLQDSLGLNGPRPFPEPPEPTDVELVAGAAVGGVAVWDDGGVCAEVEGADGQVFRTCAVPDPLRPTIVPSGSSSRSTPAVPRTRISADVGRERPLRRPSAP